MAKYLHSKYAGGDADVMKHACLASVLSKLDISVEYVETHAGAGLYDLDPDRGEHLKGIGRCRSNLTDLPALKPYNGVLEESWTLDKKIYPASPIIANSASAVKSLCLYELNRSVACQLKKNLPEAVVWEEDGFLSRHHLSHGSFVLIDPPYKSSDDYQQVVEYVGAAKQSQVRAVMVWFPMIYSDLTADLYDGLLGLYPDGQWLQLSRGLHSEGAMSGFGVFCSDSSLSSDWQLIVNHLVSSLFLQKVSYY
ncbi:23S rRNA (adenine(2030)-N(6))-methyltransferase RlmJ [Neptuniibacter caesariensis]|uniref:23S rRNA (Adenine(2030)-N(6))-methyltransferase RlmJ n=1 Tax=Neptuniibacter caesariensis TaxID=207954 RepID=A0A7U8GR42_NEPCE|nr:23S rRNA (adenine(2030)-N(6))-methyltransferase RlmJ [Neptuniibacter caesariensis]EAR59812.1 hypothetical protein MED92_08620 [Oceanospirillum sp. MED92] [Neptuniibacter caesariensis]